MCCNSKPINCPGNEKINKINDYCNDLLNEIKTSKNMYKQTLYKVNTIKIQSCIEQNK